MAYIKNFVTNSGQFVPSTNIWDVGQIYEVDVKSPEFKELLVRLYQNVNNITLSLNVKDTAYYINQEFNTSQQYYNLADPSLLTLRPGFRMTVHTGALIAGLNPPIAHGLSVNADWTWMKIYGAATNSGSLVGYPLPYADTSGNNISVIVNATNVVINNASGVTFTDSTVVLEYLKN